MDLPQEIVLFFEQDPDLIEDPKESHRSLHRPLDGFPHALGVLWMNEFGDVRRPWDLLLIALDLLQPLYLRHSRFGFGEDWLLFG